jgi:outer membrane lipoprotein SlyB
MRAGVLCALLAAGGAAQAETTAPAETKTHEFACTAATVGGAVAGVALGSLLGGGLGRTLFETAGGVGGGMLGHAMKCPK